MPRFIFAIVIFLYSLTALSFEERDVSAYRNPDLPYEHYEQLMNDVEKYSPYFNSAMGSARYYTGSNLPNATAWPSKSVVQSRFASVRNDRYIKWSRKPGFPRRISWLYPNDGCYARATMANRWFKSHGINTPSKVFAFGNLRVKTRNHPRGSVSWWYHVAPIVEVGGSKYVIDPSIESSRPLSLGEWLSRMGTPSNIKIAICGSGTQAPGSNCENQSVGSGVVSSQLGFLSKEWDQLKRMRKKPEELLGSRPPW